MSDLEAGELAAIATAGLWTLAAVIYSSVGKQIGALTLSVIRIAIACGLLVGYGRIAQGQWLPMDVPPRAWVFLSISGFCWFFLSDLCLFQAYLLIGPRLSLLIASLTPPMAAALSWICLGEPLAPWQWMAMTITLCGVGWVVLEQPRGEQPHERRQAWGKGILLAVLSAAIQAVAIVLSKEGVGQEDAMASTLIAMLGSLFGHLVAITLWRRWKAVLAAVCQRRIMLLLAVAAVIGPFAGVIFNMTALRWAPAGVVATIIATMPVMILPFSVFLHREKVSPRAIFGAVVAVAGIAWLTVP